MVHFLVVVGIAFFSTCAYGNEGKLFFRKRKLLDNKLQVQEIS